jgi:hypothetical protein
MNKKKTEVGLPSSVADHWLDRLTKFYLIPEGPFLSNWDRLVVVCTIANCILLAFMVAFNFHTLAAWIACYLIDILYLVDLYMRFHVAYLQNGFWVVFPKEMAEYYLHSREFIYDVFCNLPTDFIALGWAGRDFDSALYILCLVRLVKMIRAGKIVIYFRKQEKKLHANFTIQILKFSSYLITLTHSIACIWFSIACPQGSASSCNAPSWIRAKQLTDGVEFKVPLSSLYIHSLYWTGK